MTKSRIESIVSFIAGALLMAIFLVDRIGFGPQPKVITKRKIVTVYCLGDYDKTIFCKTVKEEYDDLTDLNYKGKFYE